MPIFLTLLRGHVINGHVSSKVTHVVNNNHSIPVIWVCGITPFQKRHRVAAWREYRIGAAPFKVFDIDDLRSWSGHFSKSLQWDVVGIDVSRLGCTAGLGFCKKDNTARGDIKVGRKSTWRAKGRFQACASQSIDEPRWRGYIFKIGCGVAHCLLSKCGVPYRILYFAGGAF